ncbi:MAG: hypothetical protein QM765_25535 [Myxococcales bacterium]
MLRTWPKQTFIAALPLVLLEEHRGTVEPLLAQCVLRGVWAEVNGWGEWHLAKRAGAKFIGGPGMGILNGLAGRELGRLGFLEATASLEADEQQLSSLLAACPLPCSVVVFGRPALMTTRVDMAPDQVAGILEDRREVRLRARRERGLWQLRPLKPFDLRRKQLPKGAAHLMVDLIGSPDPIRDWEAAAGESASFNFDRTLT